MIENWKDVQIVPEFCDQGVDCYRLEGGHFLNEYYIVSEAETRKLMNHPEVVGYEVYASLVTATSQMMYYLKEKKKKYEASVQYMYRNKSVQEKLMFIFSAENLSQTYRRMRYVQEYANYQRLQGLEIERRCKRNIKSNDSYSSVVDADSENGLTERTFYNAGLCELPYLYALVHPGTSVNAYVDSEDDYVVVKNMAYLPQNLNIYHKDR